MLPKMLGRGREGQRPRCGEVAGGSGNETRRGSREGRRVDWAALGRRVGGSGPGKGGGSRGPLWNRQGERRRGSQRK